MIFFSSMANFFFSVINVEFHGEATVNWAETEIEEYEGYRRQITQEYSANEDYFHVVQCVCGGVGKELFSYLHHHPSLYKSYCWAQTCFCCERPYFPRGPGIDWEVYMLNCFAGL